MTLKNKLWYKLELKIAKLFNGKRIAGSGSLWPNKEDAETDDLIIQCKATENKSISIKQQDLEQLVKRAIIQHKIPLFVFHLEKIKYENYKIWVSIPLHKLSNGINIIQKEKK